MVFSTIGVIPKLLFDIFPKILGLSSDAERSTKAHGKMLECRIQLSRYVKFVSSMGTFSSFGNIVPEEDQFAYM
jgi:hypothetical protein